MSVTTDRDLADLRRETEAAVLAAVKSAAERMAGATTTDDSTCTGLTDLVTAWSLVAGTRTASKPTAALRG